MFVLRSGGVGDLLGKEVCVIFWGGVKGELFRDTCCPASPWRGINWKRGWRNGCFVKGWGVGEGGRGVCFVKGWRCTVEV